MAMPAVLESEHVLRIMPWPLGAVRTAQADGEGWCDVVLELVEEIRLGGKFNSRRVRYDGRFYVSWRGRRVYCVGSLAFDVMDAAQHVYGVCKESDREHNKALKGY